MAIYDPKFNSAEMIMYLENEIKHFMREVIREWVLRSIFGI